MVFVTPMVMDMFISATGGAGWPRIYFMVFYCLINWIILNLVIAMMLEIFTNVSDEQDCEFKKQKNIQTLMEHQKRLGNHRFEQVMDEINEDIMREEVN